MLIFVNILRVCCLTGKLPFLLMNYILFDTNYIRTFLLPLTYFRPISKIRCGILTLKEKWEYVLQSSVSVLTEEYLLQKFPVKYQQDNIYINSAVFPDERLVAAINKLQRREVLVKNDLVLAIRQERLTFDAVQTIRINDDNKVLYQGEVEFINRPYDIFTKNAKQIKSDFSLITSGRTGQKLSSTNTKIGKHPVFLEEGAVVEAVIFNTDDGPVYIGKNVKILEGSMIRGPFAALENSVVKMGAKIYGGTTLGPNTKAGGEIKDTVFFGNANKGHDGYLGDSVIAEWCNLGADTNNSNLKNNYSNVKLWDYNQRNFVDTGLQFCGLIMGDHSKCGIATMFNTGTVVGVCSNIFGGNYQPKFFPSFKWGGQQHTDYRYDKAVEVAKAVMKRRQKQFDKTEADLFEKVYHLVKEIER